MGLSLNGMSNQAWEIGRLRVHLHDEIYFWNIESRDASQPYLESPQKKRYRPKRLTGLRFKIHIYIHADRDTPS